MVKLLICILTDVIFVEMLLVPHLLLLVLVEIIREAVFLLLLAVDTKLVLAL